MNSFKIIESFVLQINAIPDFDLLNTDNEKELQNTTTSNPKIQFNRNGQLKSLQVQKDIESKFLERISPYIGEFYDYLESRIIRIEDFLINHIDSHRTQNFQSLGTNDMLYELVENLKNFTNGDRSNVTWTMKTFYEFTESNPYLR
ncbi:MAG: hypothetical protein H7A24_09080 [Leptospiraceae bacterium]|nr:hypothetical protein [Leptospiraceae bacterium]MCP5512022.1 hypothetical protein [Leptospiraceae bacterium]